MHRLALPLCALALLPLARCGGGGSSDPGVADHPLDGFETTTVQIRGEPIFVWVARTAAEQAQGLMGITPAEIAPLPDGTPRGMLFVWTTDELPSFWMKDTLIPLDLAYIEADGRIAELHALVPLDTTGVPSSTPVRYALEVPSGTLASRGIEVGDVVTLAAP